MQSFFRSAEQERFVRCVSRLIACNPFLEERIALEREALGGELVAGARVWSAAGVGHVPSPNAVRLAERASKAMVDLRARLGLGVRPNAEEQRLYEELVLYVLYATHDAQLLEVVRRSPRPGAPAARLDFYEELETSWRVFLGSVEGLRPSWEAPHIFSICLQLRCAFEQIHRHIVGGSLPAARLRSAVWQSIFTHDMRRYVRSLYTRMGDLTTLILGPSGTGKELVARAIGLSRYIPFDPQTRTLAAGHDELFRALSLSALSPSLIESELFGHRKGAFTGALSDRSGWLETCPALGSVFLDEIGELDAGVQVKLLRVLQTRRFERLGETRPRTFQGKVLAATNRDLGEEIEAGRFRADFYYRLCSDIVEVPTLRERLEDSPDELEVLLLALSSRLVGESEAPELAAEVGGWISAHLGPGYAWPGNVRELEQCLRNVLIRGRYTPLRGWRPEDAAALPEALGEGRLTASELLDRYCALVHARTGSYVETARRLGLDRRTVQRRAARALAATQRSGA
jgi:DNA-binding NtrC family response regulator